MKHKISNSIVPSNQTCLYSFPILFTDVYSTEVRLIEKLVLRYFVKRGVRRRPSRVSNKRGRRLASPKGDTFDKEQPRRTYCYCPPSRRNKMREGASFYPRKKLHSPVFGIMKENTVSNFSLRDLVGSSFSKRVGTKYSSTTVTVQLLMIQTYISSIKFVS